MCITHRTVRPWPAVFSGVVAVAALLTPVVLSAPAASAAPVAGSYASQTLHFKVSVGSNRTQTCDIVGLLFTPSSATSRNRVPAILTTNGFGGSDADQVPFAEKEAALGYVVLSYSGLGFGGSGCKITLDDPDYDGQAASQLVSYLGGAGGSPLPTPRTQYRPRRCRSSCTISVTTPGTRTPTIPGSACGVAATAARSSSPRRPSTRGSTHSTRRSPGTTCPTP